VPNVNDASLVFCLRCNGAEIRRGSTRETRPPAGQLAFIRHGCTQRTLRWSCSENFDGQCGEADRRRRTGSSGRRASRFRRCIRFRPIRNAGATSVALLDLVWRNRVSRLPSVKRMPNSALGHFAIGAGFVRTIAPCRMGPGPEPYHFGTRFRFGARSWPCSVARPVRLDSLVGDRPLSGGPFGWSDRSGTGEWIKSTRSAVRQVG
jgi:hypothetical protein